MAIKKRDFQKIAAVLHEFLSKLSCEESTATLRDSIKLVLFYMQSYYKKLRNRSLSNSASPRSPNLAGTLILSGAVSPVSPACGVPDQFEWKWFNLESPRLSASLGTAEFSSIPLILQAGKSGDIELLKELLAKDPEEITQLDGLGRNVVMYSVHGNTASHTEFLEVLVDVHCDLNLQANDGTTALHIAAHDNNTSALSLLLKHKASCNIEDNQGRTPLHWAASSPSVENVKLLLQSGGDLNAEDKEGLTPAMWACHFDQLRNLQVLQEALSRIDPEEDALFNETDNYGQCVIHWAVRGTGSLECLEALLNDQAFLLRDNDGKTVLHTAAEQGNVAACEMILEMRGGREGLLDADNSKRTALHLAAMCGQGEVVNFLLDSGADLLLEDAFGASALDHIQNKQLNYCDMVIRAHPQGREHLTTVKQKFMSESATISSEKQTEVYQTLAPPIGEIFHENCTEKTETVDNKASFSDQNNDVWELHGFDVESGAGVVDVSGKGERKQFTAEEIASKVDKKGSDDRGKEKAYKKNRRQSTLMRQSGFHVESDLQDSQEAPSFDLRTEDGNILVVVSNLGDNNDNDQGDMIDVKDKDIEIDCEDNIEYSSMRLQQGHGSASSVHSEPDNADNCSVSVGLSVSSLGSDNEEVPLEDDDVDCNMGGESRQASKDDKVIDTQWKISPESVTIPSQKSPWTPHSQSTEQLHSSTQSLHASQESVTEQEGEKYGMNSKKKKDKGKKKKQKVSTVTELLAPLPPPRGSVPPLDSSTLGTPLKLGALDPRGIKPGPWEHSGLGPLRLAPPEPLPPSPRMGRPSEHAKRETVDTGDYNSNGDGVERPRTPEPPRSPHEMGGQVFYPSPPNSARLVYDGPFRGHFEEGFQEREMNYGTSHGPMALANSQGMLRNMDIIGRNQKMESWPVKSMGQANKGGGLHVSQGQQTFSLHGPVPHPPNR